MIPKEIIFCLMFGSFGFLLAFFLFRTVNIALILLLAWVPFKVLERYGYLPDWKLFYEASEHLMGLGESLFHLLTGLITTASTGAMIFFVLGGITGIVMNKRVRTSRM